MAQVDVATSSWRLTTIHLAHKGASSSHNIAWITHNRPFLSTGFDQHSPPSRSSLADPKHILGIHEARAQGSFEGASWVNLDLV